MSAESKPEIVSAVVATPGLSELTPRSPIVPASNPRQLRRIGANPSRRATSTVAKDRHPSVGLGPTGVVVPRGEISGPASVDENAAFVISRALGVVVVTAHGHLDAVAGDALESALAELIEDQAYLTVIIDLHDVSVVDFGCLDAFAASAEWAADRGAELTFADPAPAVATALASFGLADSIVSTSPPRLRLVSALSPSSSELSKRERRRASMAQHPAGSDGDTHHP